MRHLSSSLMGVILAMSLGGCRIGHSGPSATT
jgi:hypothetical protein